ncbi:MAG: hypothetical protein QNJ90_03635 [Planctomycetota bacterium]|nr:hypothetical protein [Planctomycetota bacterium]
MTRLATRCFALFILGLAALVLPVADAHAGHVSGTIPGNEILPEAVEDLRDIAEWKHAARQDYAEARYYGDRREMAQINAEWAQAERDEAAARRALQQATTHVSVYGDAAQVMPRSRIIKFLRGTGNWRRSAVHIWQRKGKLLWGLRAPIGYDETRSKPRGSTSGSTSSNVLPRPKPPVATTSPYGVTPPRTWAPIVPHAPVTVKPAPRPSSTGGSALGAGFISQTHAIK